MDTNSVLTGLLPIPLWKNFDEISQIPRKSKNEAAIQEFIWRFGINLDLNTKRDDTGNIAIFKPATPGYENRKPIIAQAHLDMVCEKNTKSSHNFATDPIQFIINGEWMTAKGTSAGFDNGIGAASIMAVLEATDIEHGPFIGLFTTDEETGLTGAFGLKSGFLPKDAILLNTDSEAWREIFVGCAGGKKIKSTWNYKEELPSNLKSYEICITGLKGGHSGDDIDKGFENAIRILAKVLASTPGLRIASMATGTGGTAIPREGNAIVFLPPESNTNEVVNYWMNWAKEKLTNEDEIKNFKITIEPCECESSQKVMEPVAQKAILQAVLKIPNGVIEMSDLDPKIVETSTNLGIFEIKDRVATAVAVQRSFSNEKTLNLYKKIANIFEKAGAKTESPMTFSGWTPNVDSEVLKIMVAADKKRFGEQPIVRVIHAGLECGVFLEAYPNWDVISFGPTLKHVHSPDEKLEIATVEPFFQLFTDVLKMAPAQKN